MKDKIFFAIDRFPEAPFYVLAVAYLLKNPFTSIHVFSVAFQYIILSLALGLMLKAVFKDKRPGEYTTLPLVRYDTPSLHTLVSAGATVYAYIINPVLGFILAPFALLYMYSRLHLKVHSGKAVVVGAVAGVLLGFFAGTILLEYRLPYVLDYLLFSAFFFITPFIAALRLKLL
ncbi:MAG TPA: phosphatase PAP2 family protein [Candidatus Altiarchaeales archaeon]|mgnify:CR=1 FL=1|nr:phosphatase PAP2 family protein [Candidatus Altiarchaeales archaeon]